MTHRLTYTYDFSNFNTGTWEWGTPGGLIGDGVTLNITAVPEPITISLLCLSVAVCTLRRRRRIA